jgi:hypothetical protein
LNKSLKGIILNRVDDVSNVDGVGDETLAKERFANSAPDFIAELRFRINTMEDRVLQGGRLTMSEEEALTVWKEIVQVSEVSTSVESENEDEVKIDSTTRSDAEDMPESSVTRTNAVTTSPTNTSKNKHSAASNISMSSNTSSDDDSEDIRKCEDILQSSIKRRVRSGSHDPVVSHLGNSDEDKRTSIGLSISQLREEDTRSPLRLKPESSSCLSSGSAVSRVRGRSLEPQKNSPSSESITVNSFVIASSVSSQVAQQDLAAMDEAFHSTESPERTSEAADLLLSVGRRSFSASKLNSTPKVQIRTASSSAEPASAPKPRGSTSKRLAFVSSSPAGLASSISITTGSQRQSRRLHSPVLRDGFSSSSKAPQAAGTNMFSPHITRFAFVVK